MGDKGPFANTVEWRVAWGHCDPAGIVFNPRFLETFDDCTARLLEAATGLGKRALLELHQAAGVPLVSTSLRFQRPVRYGETARIVSTVTKTSNSSFGVQHVLSVDDERACIGDEVRVWTVKDGKGQLRSAALPAPVRNALVG